MLPIPAIVPILLYIGLLIGAQAFRAVPRIHAAAVVAAIVPNLASWGAGLIDNALAAAGTSAAQLGEGPLTNAGLVYHGLHVLGQGAVLAGIVFGAIVTFILDRNPRPRRHRLRCRSRAVVGRSAARRRRRLGGGPRNRARLPPARAGPPRHRAPVAANPPCPEHAADEEMAVAQAQPPGPATLGRPPSPRPHLLAPFWPGRFPRYTWESRALPGKFPA